MAVNKVILGADTVIDLTEDTVEAEYLLEGYTAHDKSGDIITGTLSADVDIKAQQKTATPKLSWQTVYPDEGYDYLTNVVVEPIPYTYTDNEYGGQTLTIG